MDPNLSAESLQKQVALMEKQVAAFERSNQFFDMLIQSLPGLFYLFDNNFEVLKWNKNVETVTGYSAKEVAATSLFELFEGTGLESVKKTIQQVFDKGRGEVETLLVTKDGRRIPYFFSGVSATIEKDSYLVGVGLDVSERTRAKKAQTESENLYRLLAERMTEGVVLVSNFRVLFANNAFISIFGYEKAEELIGVDLLDLIAEGYRMYFKDMCTALESGMCTERFFQARWLTKKGEMRWIEGIGNQLEWQGQPTVLLTARDITEAKLKEISMQEEADNLRRQNVKLRTSIKERYRFGKIVGKSAPMQKIYEQILNSSAASASVVIYGESGTGKELVARAVHELSRRSQKKFVAVNSSAIPENLLESEFFGHKKGAFTNAYSDRPGYLDLADGGTLFLDEVGDLTPSLQAKLLRVLEEGTYSPVGSSVVKHADFRLLSATNKNLAELVKKGDMREDFFYRIHIIPINLPPLRDRKEDIPLLVEDFLESFTTEKRLIHLPGNVMETLTNYHWPGNVRELQNVIQRYLAVGLVELLAGPAGRERASGETAAPAELENTGGSLQESIDHLEAQIISKTIREYNGNKSRAAEVLNVSRKTLARKMKRFGLE